MLSFNSSFIKPDLRVCQDDFFIRCLRSSLSALHTPAKPYTTATDRYSRNVLLLSRPDGRRRMLIQPTRGRARARFNGKAI